MKDGTLLSNAMQETLSFSSVMLSGVGQYTCEVTINNRRYSSAVKEITVASKNQLYYAMYMDLVIASL